MERYKMMFRKNKNKKLIEQLENTGMINIMSSQFDRFKSVNNHSNLNAIWQKWIRK